MSRRYYTLPEEKKEEVLQNAITEITQKLNLFETKGWHLSLKKIIGNFITVEYSSKLKFTDNELLDFEDDLTRHLKQSYFADKMYRLEFDDKLIRTGILDLKFRIRNSGFYSKPKPKEIESISENETNSRKEEKSLPDSDPIKNQPKGLIDQTRSNKDQTKCRKAVRIPKAWLKAWNPDKIRKFIDSKEYESNKMFDRSNTIKQKSDKNQTISKTIWLSGEQGRKWNSEKVKLYLLSALSNEIPETENSNNNNFKKGFSILVEAFNFFMVSDPEFKQKIIDYGQDHEDEFTDLQEEIEKLKGGETND